MLGIKVKVYNKDSEKYNNLWFENELGLIQYLKNNNVDLIEAKPNCEIRSEDNGK